MHFSSQNVHKATNLNDLQILLINTTKNVCVLCSAGGGEGEGGCSETFCTGRLHSEVQPLTLSTEKASFRIPSMDKWTPVQIRWVFNCCKCTIKPESFIGFFTAMKCIY